MAKQKSLITGASSGIGATYAERLASRGHDLVLVARDKARLDALAARLGADSGVSVEVIQADLAEPADLLRVEVKLREDCAITQLINNAGIAGGGPVASADSDALEALIRLNVIALTRLSAAAAASFTAQGRGTIVNISSVTALAPESFEATYLASKSYVLAFSQALDAELSPQGVRVQVVLPGITRTEIWERSGHDLEALPPEKVMSVGDMVDAALDGLDMGELVTIPSLPNADDWVALEEARLKLGPNLSHARPAERYRIRDAVAA